MTSPSGGRRRPLPLPPKTGLLRAFSAATSGASARTSAQSSAKTGRSGPTAATLTLAWATTAVGGGATARRAARPTESREREFTAQAPEAPYSGELVPCTGLLDLREEGYGFLRTNGYLASSSDVYVSITQVRRYGLRKGDVVEGAYRPAANNEKYPALVRADSVSGLGPDDARNRPKFENLTPLFPDQKLSLEVPGDPANVDGADSRPGFAHRQGPAWDDRVASQPKLASRNGR